MHNGRGWNPTTPYPGSTWLAMLKTVVIKTSSNRRCTELQKPDTATRIWTRSGLIHSNTAAALSPNFQIELAGSLLSMQGELPNPNLAAVVHYCGIGAHLDPNHVQTCGDLAATLVERSRTAIEVLIGGRIAEQVSWANPRLASLRDEADAMRWQLFRMQESQQAQMLLGCYSTQRLLRNVIAQAQFGESGRLRQELAARGVTTAQAAEAWRVARRWQR